MLNVQKNVGYIRSGAVCQHTVVINVNIEEGFEVMVYIGLNCQKMGQKCITHGQNV